MLSYSLNTIFAFSSLVLLTFSHPTLFFKITKRSKFNYSHKKRKDFDWIDFSLPNWHDQSNIFWPKHSKVSKMFALMGSFLSKVYTVWTKKVQRSFLSSHWRVTQNLEGNWLVVSKLTWQIWQVLTPALNSLKNFHFNELFLTNVYNVWSTKSTDELCLIRLKTDAKFQGKHTFTFKNDMRNLASFHRLKNCNFILESKMAELNQNTNSKQPYRPDAVWKLYFTLEKNK